MSANTKMADVVLAAAWRENRARREPREALARALRIAAAALDGDWELVARVVEPCGDATCWPERQREAIMAWGDSTPEARAAELDRADAAGEIDLGGEPDEIVAAVRAAVDAADQRCYERSAEAALRARAVPGGRYEVVSFARGSMAVCGEVLAFAEAETAEAWLAVAHPHDPTCGYVAQVMDREAA